MGFGSYERAEIVFCTTCLCPSTLQLPVWWFGVSS